MRYHSSALQVATILVTLAGRKYVWQLKFQHKSPIDNQQIWKGKKKLRNLLMFGQIIKCTIAILRKIFFVTILFSKAAIHLKATFWKRELGAFQLL